MGPEPVEASSLWSAVRVAGDFFITTVGDLDDDQLRSPSLLPGWTRAHVVAHVSLNAEGFITAARALRAGAEALMYPDGVAQREADIAGLAREPRTAIVDRAVEANREFLRLCAPPLPRGRCATAPDHPTFSSASIPGRRLRELQVHLIDLGLSEVGIDDWLPEFVDSDLVLQWPTVRHRTTEAVSVQDEDGTVWATSTGRTAKPMATMTRRRLLAWVLDRAPAPDLPVLLSWSNRSKWEHSDQFATSPGQPPTAR